jgi:protein-L-isoaspartate(D-aspartate) O-methyltransferase
MMEHDAAQLLMFLMELRKQGIIDTRLLKALETIPFYRFMQHAQAMDDAIMAAKLLQSLPLHDRSIVLEVGRRHGYYTALLSRLSRRVISAAEHKMEGATHSLLQELHCTNVTTVIQTQQEEGWHDAAPYDVIFVHQPCVSISPHLLAQLNDGGQLLLPLGTVHQAQWRLISHEKGQFSTKMLKYSL